MDVERLKRRLRDALEDLDAESPIDSDRLANDVAVLALDRGGNPSLEFHAKQIRAAKNDPARLRREIAIVAARLELPLP